MRINKNLKKTLFVGASALMMLSVGGGAVNAMHSNVHADDTSLTKMINDAKKHSNDSMPDPEHMFGGHPNYKELNREKREGRNVNPDKFIVPANGDNESFYIKPHSSHRTKNVTKGHHKRIRIRKHRIKRTKRSWAQQIYRELSRLKRQIKSDRTKLTRLHRSKKSRRIRRTLRKHLAQRRHLTRQLRDNDSVKRNASLIRKYHRALKRTHRRFIKNRYRRTMKRLSKQNKKLNYQLKH